MSVEGSAITKVESVNDGLSIIQEKGLSQETQNLCEELAEESNELTSTLEEFGWTTEYTIRIGKNRPRFDGFKESVGLEHESREQMNVRSHLLWMEAAYQREKSDTGLESLSRGIEAGIFIIPADNDASVERTKRELGDKIFTKYFPIECPIVLIEYQ